LTFLDGFAFSKIMPFSISRSSGLRFGKIAGCGFLIMPPGAVFTACSRTICFSFLAARIMAGKVLVDPMDPLTSVMENFTSLSCLHVTSSYFNPSSLETIWTQAVGLDTPISLVLASILAVPSGRIMTPTMLGPGRQRHAIIQRKPIP